MNEKLKAIRDAINAELKLAQAILDKAEAEKRPLTEEELTAFNAHDATMQQWKNQFEHVEKMEATREKFAEPKQPISAPRESGILKAGFNDKEKKQFSIARAFYAIANKSWDAAPFEKEVFDSLRAAKAQQTWALDSIGTTTTGGYLVPGEFNTELIELLVAKAILGRLGATMLDGLTGSPLYIPKLTSGATASWIGPDNAQISATDQAVGQLSLTPHKLAAMTKISNTLLRLSNPSAEAMVRNDLMGALSRGFDRAGLWGSGSSYQPTGLLPNGTYASATCNKFELGDNGDAIAYADLTRLQMEPEVDNAPETALGWAFNSHIKKQLADLVDTNNRPLLGWDPSGPTPGRTLLGEPWQSSNQIPSTISKGAGTYLSAIFYGAWSEIIMAQWSNIELSASAEAGDSFEYDQTWVRAILLGDVGVRHAESFCVVADVETSLSGT